MPAKKLNLDEDPRTKAVLALLLGFRSSAAIRGLDPEEGAAAWPVIREAAGADTACLRSLAGAGLVQAVGGSDAAQNPRPESRFVLTEAGCRLACEVAATPVGPRLAIRSCRRPPAPGEKPRWDRITREVWFAGEVVLRFRRGARNQQRILDAFQEQGWPAEIDDPLPRRGRGKPGARLRDTIRHLNAGANRQRIANLFPTAPRLLFVVSDRQHLAYPGARPIHPLGPPAASSAPPSL